MQEHSADPIRGSIGLLIHQMRKLIFSLIFDWWASVNVAPNVESVRVVGLQSPLSKFAPVAQPSTLVPLDHVLVEQSCAVFFGLKFLEFLHGCYFLHKDLAFSMIFFRSLPGNDPVIDFF